MSMAANVLAAGRSTAAAMPRSSWSKSHSSSRWITLSSWYSGFTSSRRINDRASSGDGSKGRAASAAGITKLGCPPPGARHPRQ
jgi:hypothetical protein